MAQFVYIWRNKPLAMSAESIGEMAEALEAGARELRAMEADGVLLLDDGGVEDDYATLVTSDEDIAAKYDFQDDDLNYDGEYDDCEWDELEDEDEDV